MRRELQPRKDLPVVTAAGGLAWEAFEIAHTLEYIRHFFHQPEIAGLTHLAGHLPPIGLFLIGVMWCWSRRKHERPSTAIRAVRGSSKSVRQRTFALSFTVTTREQREDE